MVVTGRPRDFTVCSGFRASKSFFSGTGWGMEMNRYIGTVGLVALNVALQGYAQECQDRVEITVFPSTSRVIGDEGTLDRTRYFSICDHGTDFRRRCKDDNRYAYLKKQDITFGRKLGVVAGAVKYSQAVQEDPDRPGFMDVGFYTSALDQKQREPDAVMVKDFGKLDIAAHENHNAFPGFMGEFKTGPSSEDHKPQTLPLNIEAAAELSAYVLKYDFNDFNRPSFYEPVNEPHWSFYDGDHLSAWHLKTMDKVHEMVPGVKVGGPCSSVGYFYKKDYKRFDGFASFIDATDCRMDFYSYHIYDYYRPGNGDFAGRISSGLPCESVFDLVQSYTMNKHGKEVDLVFSEHGGYESDKAYTQKLGKKISGSGFKTVMKRRSIENFTMMNSAVANTMSFMNNPHIVQKAVPFILMESMDWDPEYYATLYTPHDFKDKNNWVPSHLIDFYRLFKGIEGRYVKIISPDPDVQALAFVNGSKLFIILNNMSRTPVPVGFNIKKAPGMTIRRLGRNDDFTPYFSETRLNDLKTVNMKGLESVVLMLDYKVDIPEKQVVVEKAYYAEKAGISLTGQEHFTVMVPRDRPLDAAVLRIGVSRPSGAGYGLNVVLNGQSLTVPVEDCAERLDQEGQEYASLKLVNLEPALVQGTNTVTVSFPDDDGGAVGAVVIRAAHVKR